MPAAVFVVHDNSQIRGLTTYALRAAGYEVTAFDSPIAVLDAMDSPTRIEVLVTRVDFGPGTLNGAALARMARVKQPTAKVVFVARQRNRDYTAELGRVPLPLDPQGPGRGRR